MNPVTIYGSEFRAIQGFLYIEYGVTRRLTAITQLSGSSLQSESNGRHTGLRLNTSGLGDVVLGAKFQLVGEPIVLSPYLSVKIPTYYDNDLNPALGTGDADVELKVLTARSFHPLPLFIGMEAGYRARDGPFSNQIRFSGEAGATPSSRLSFKAYLEESKTLSGDIRLAEPGLVQVSEGDFTKLGLIAGFRARGPLWMEVALESVLAGKNVSAGHAWGLALSYSHR